MDDEKSVIELMFAYGEICEKEGVTSERAVTTRMNVSSRYWELQQRDAQHKAELELAVIEARIDELNTMYGRITSEITVGGNNWPNAIKFRIDNRIEALTKGSE